MHATFTTRARVYLSLTLLALLLAAAAAPLALRARHDRAAADGLVREDLVFAASVAEIRVLSLRLQNEAVQAALRPGDGSFAARSAAEGHVIAEELRRARLHAPDHGAVDVVDELENSVLRFAAAAERVFTAAAAGREADARAAVVQFGEEGQLQTALSEELATIAATAAEERAHAIDGSGRGQALLLLAVAGLVLSAEAFILAINESGRAIALALSGFTPDRFQHVLPWADARTATAGERPAPEGSADSTDDDDGAGPEPLSVLNPEQAAAMAAALKPAGEEVAVAPAASTAA